MYHIQCPFQESLVPLPIAIPDSRKVSPNRSPSSRFPKFQSHRLELPNGGRIRGEWRMRALDRRKLVFRPIGHRNKYKWILPTRWLPVISGYCIGSLWSRLSIHSGVPEFWNWWNLGKFKKKRFKKWGKSSKFR